MSYNTKNYTEQGGERTVIGGEIEILAGAKIKADEGAEVEGFGGGEYTLPPATAEVLGGIKVGAGLSVEEDGTLSADGITKAENQAESEATEVADLVTEFNSLLSKLKTAGLMEADSE